MSKKSCPILIVFSLWTNWQNFLDIQHVTLKNVNNCTVIIWDSVRCFVFATGWTPDEMNVVQFSVRSPSKWIIIKLGLNGVFNHLIWLGGEGGWLKCPFSLFLLVKFLEIIKVIFAASKFLSVSSRDRGIFQEYCDFCNGITMVK